MKTKASNLAPMGVISFVPGFGTKDITDSGTGRYFENKTSAPDKNYEL